MSSRLEQSTRRGLLAVGATLLAGLAGCPSGSTDTGDPSGSTDTGAPSDPTYSPTDSSLRVEDVTATVRGTPTLELDLGEANVVGVEFEGGGGTYRFDVTLYHDDDGEDGYANWWQVESLAGDRLGRRTLLHAHSTAPFTRSETVDVPAGTTCVVVRGHDQTHGYGGQAMVVDLATGATRRREQGPEPSAFDERDCP